MPLTRWGASALLGIIFGLVCAGTLPVAAQIDSSRTQIARFRDAQALAIDPMGRLYVADAGRDVVRILDRMGEDLGMLGGSGTRAGEFDSPTDVDPTNGQSVWVADAGNGRVQRFSEEGLFLEALPVGAAFLEGQSQRAFDDGRDGAAMQGDGRPIAVVSSSGDDTFVIDERNDTVLKWDDQRRPERILGAMSGGEGDPQQPVALALDGSRRLYVADWGQQAVLEYDLFGTFVRRLDAPPLPKMQDLSMHRGRLWIVCADRVFVWRSDTNTIVEHAVDLPSPLVDAAKREGDLFLLTATALYRRLSW